MYPVPSWVTATVSRPATVLTLKFLKFVSSAGSVSITTTSPITKPWSSSVVIVATVSLFVYVDV